MRYKDTTSILVKQEPLYNFHDEIYNHGIDLIRQTDDLTVADYNKKVIIYNQLIEINNGGCPQGYEISGSYRLVQQDIEDKAFNKDTKDYNIDQITRLQEIIDAE